MRHSTERLLWIACGFILGCLFTLLHAAWSLWPFQDDAVLAWTRWAGKEGIKWTFISVTAAVVFFVVLHLVNGAWTVYQLKREARRKRPTKNAA